LADLKTLRRELIRYYLRYEPRRCPHFSTCRDAEDRPKCIYPYYLVCRTHQLRKLFGGLCADQHSAGRVGLKYGGGC